MSVFPGYGLLNIEVEKELYHQPIFFFFLNFVVGLTTHTR
jgi:hypothetical protein